MNFALQNPANPRVNLPLGGVNLGQIYVNLDATGICESRIRIYYQSLKGDFQIPRNLARESVNLENTPFISGAYSRFTDSQKPTLPTGERDAFSVLSSIGRGSCARAQGVLPKNQAPFFPSPTKEA